MYGSMQSTFLLSSYDYENVQVVRNSKLENFAVLFCSYKIYNKLLVSKFCIVKCKITVNKNFFFEMFKISLIRYLGWFHYLLTYSCNLLPKFLHYCSK